METLRQQRLVLRYGPRVLGPDDCVLETISEDMPTGQKSRTRWGAEGLHVVIRKTYAVRGQTAKVRRSHDGAVWSLEVDVGIAQVCGVGEGRDDENEDENEDKEPRA